MSLEESKPVIAPEPAPEPNVERKVFIHNAEVKSAVKNLQSKKVATDIPNFTGDDMLDAIINFLSRQKRGEYHDVRSIIIANLTRLDIESRDTSREIKSKIVEMQKMGKVEFSSSALTQLDSPHYHSADAKTNYYNIKNVAIFAKLP